MASATDKGGEKPRKAKAKRASPRGGMTRDRILDAAESLFAQRGYYGASLRDIALVAEVDTPLVSYHFGSKDGLFLAVVERRAAEHQRDMIDALEAAIADAAPGLPSNAALVRAYGGPPLEKIGRGKGWAAYIRLLVAIQNLDRRDPVSVLANPVYDDTILRFVSAFIAVNPDVPRRKLYMAIYFLHGSFIHVLSNVVAFERLLPEEERLQGAPDMIDYLADLFEASLR